MVKMLPPSVCVPGGSCYGPQFADGSKHPQRGYLWVNVRLPQFERRSKNCTHVETHAVETRNTFLWHRDQVLWSKCVKNGEGEYEQFRVDRHFRHFSFVQEEGNVVV